MIERTAGEGSRTADRVGRLQVIAATLAGAPSARAAAGAFVLDALGALLADAAMVAILEPGSTELEIVASAGLPAASVSAVERLSLSSSTPLAEAARTGLPSWPEPVETRASRYPHLADEYARSGMRAFTSLPLVVQGRVLGSVAVGYQQMPAFDAEDRALALALVQQLALTLDRLRAVAAERAAREEAERARERLGFLAQASALLADSLDVRATLQSVARLAVPRVADWCGVYLPDGELLLPLAAEHADPERVRELWEYLEQYPTHRDASTGTALVLRTGEPQLVPEILDELLAATARDPDQLRAIRSLGLRSFMAAPMTARGRTIGVIALAIAESGRRFSPDDLELAVELGRRAAVAVDNARLYEESLAAGARLERRVLERTIELETHAGALDAFVRFTQAVGTQAEPTALARRALEVLVASLEGASAAHFVPSDGRWRAVDFEGPVPDEALQALRDGLDPNAPTVRLVLSTQDAAFLDGYDGAPDGLGERVAAFAAAAACPIVVGAEVRSAFTVGRRDARAWTEPERAIVRAVGRAFSLALERAALVENLGRQAAELEARNSEQETFVYTVSHDLRAPLLALQGMAALLREAVETSDAGGAEFALGRVEANVRRMGDLLDDLLALSRAGRAGAVPEAIDLGACAAEVLRDLEPRLGARGISVEQPGAWPLVKYPPSELGQILANLIGNAAKWAGRAPGQSTSGPPAKPPVLRLSWSVDDEQVVLRVEDNGPGIGPAHRERVFALFQKLDAKAEGTGVGLAIVKRIAERHGGSVRVEDSDLGGASFAVTLPAAGPTDPGGPAA